MIKIFPYENLGHTDLGWLDARYHFSFADYQNPERMGFHNLRVINDDIVSPGKGFDTHGHNDMEIITFVRRGAITHKDSQGNEGRTEAGDVQVMSAGSGIRHSEFNHEAEETNMFQIWILPRKTGIPPRWEAREFPKEAANDSLPLLVSGYEGDQEAGALTINADARIFGGQLRAGHSLEHSISKDSYLLVLDGEIELEGQNLKKGDGAEITGTDSITITALSDAEIVVIETAGR